MPLTEIVPGRFFRQISRPGGVMGALPFHTRFHDLDTVEAHSRHLARDHQHLDYELLLIERGPYRCLINQVMMPAVNRGLVIVKPGDWHQDSWDQPVLFHALRLRVLPGPTPDRSANLLAADLPVTAQVLLDAEPLFDLVGQAIAEGERPGPFTVHLLDAIAGRFVAELLRALPSAHVDPRLVAAVHHHGFSRDLHDLFARRIGDHLSPDEMAKALEMSPRSLTARCRAAFHSPPARLFMRHKMERARTLLVQTDLPIKAISDHLGFSNPYHFSTAYKRIHGHAPTQER